MSAGDPRFVTSSDGTSIACWRTGEGPPLLLVHGTTADHSRWARVESVLAMHHTVYTMDRRGRGASGDGRSYRLDLEVDDILAVVDAIGRPSSVLGHSFGGLCSLEAACRTAAINRLVLYEPALPVGVVIVPPMTLTRIDELVERGEAEAALLLFMEEVVHVPPTTLELMRSLPAWQTRIAAAHTIPRESRVEELYQFDSTRFEDLSTPTLLLVGSESPHFLRKATEVLHAALPDSRIAVLAGQQHVAMDTAPELFTREVLSFLSAAAPEAN